MKAHMRILWIGLVTLPAIGFLFNCSKDSSSSVDTYHSHSMPSALVNKVRSPRIASKINRS